MSSHTMLTPHSVLSDIALLPAAKKAPQLAACEIQHASGKIGTVVLWCGIVLMTPDYNAAMSVGLARAFSIQYARNTSHMP